MAPGACDARRIEYCRAGDSDFSLGRLDLHTCAVGCARPDRRGSSAIAARSIGSSRPVSSGGGVPAPGA